MPTLFTNLVCSYRQGLARTRNAAKERPMKLLFALPLWLIPAFAYAQTPANPQIMADVQAGQFPQAEQLAAATGDPLVKKLVNYFRLLSPGGASADEIQSFITQNPDWPMQGLLKLREEQASGVYQPPAPTFTPDFIAKSDALHDQGQDQQAARLWEDNGQAAMSSASAGQQLMFWPAQNELARALLMAGDAKDAYQVIAAVAPPQAALEQNLDRDFLAGFVQLQFLNDPAQAATWFQQLARASNAVITQARAYYWLARSSTGTEAQQDYARAAAYPTTFYGQLAALAEGQTPQQLALRIQSLPEPAITMQDALRFGLEELPRAALLLVQMGDTHDAQIFLNRIGYTALDDQSRLMAAKLALGLGFPQSAVSIARQAGIAGQMLVHQGWPIPYNPPSSIIEPSIALGIMRQESSFNTTAISGSGAIGLMQLMPGTARDVSRRYGLPDDDLFNPAQNMALGSTYLAHQINNFGVCIPLAIAAYNAGPGNVANWLGTYGNPGLGSQPGGADILTWIEEIPFNQTRDYVERVSENITIYRALLTGAATSPITACGNQK